MNNAPDSPRPTVSVLISTYERTAELILTLENLRKQTYALHEILVIDDASPSQTVERVVKEGFPEVTYHRLPKNHGLIGARKIGMRTCTGKYVLNLDDDSWPVAPDAVERAVALMEQDEKIGVLALNIMKTGCPPTWPESIHRFLAPQYTGCGYVARREVILEHGEYVPEFVRQGEESDRSIRLIGAGYKIVAEPAIVVEHAVSPKNRDNKKAISLNFVNALRREILRAPYLLMPVGTARACAYAFNNRRKIDWQLVRSNLKLRGPNSVSAFFKMRRPVGMAAYTRWHLMSYRLSRTTHDVPRYAKGYRTA